MQLLPDHLKISWQAMKSKRITADDFVRLQERQGLEAYRSIWRQALLLVTYLFWVKKLVVSPRIPVAPNE